MTDTRTAAAQIFLAPPAPAPARCAESMRLSEELRRRCLRLTEAPSEEAREEKAVVVREMEFHHKVCPRCRAWLQSFPEQGK